ncbi:MAG: RRXRR domain-containing protein [Giesbergeria sp.]|uniref:RRXRR domain-containing protein n=1 Tax=Giesbergeria sp. TaxID=2818473 RepID=UPI002633EB49|nr:RRXRR domain-containing protein [Giesbergeria sp.]MDD2610413.1 RRXRR domain-containing protein [Giesbergeria sp.]
MAVFVLDFHGKALMPCTEKRARLLLARGRARVHRIVPMVIRLTDRQIASCDLQPLHLKLDPGSKTTGLALVRDAEIIDQQSGEVQAAAVVLNLMELIHRGKQISEALTARRQMRRRRRGHLRYRAPRFLKTNLTLACACCNQKKAARSIEEFLAKDPKRLAKILADAKKPLRDAAAVNATRWALANTLKSTNLPVELASGGQTKFNRCTLGIPKTHALDAACVGKIQAIENWQCPTLTLKATGRGSYQRTRLNKFGFPRGYLMRRKRVHGFGTGDMVRAEVPSGLKAGIHIGRVAIRASGSFNIQSYQDGQFVVVQGISHKRCRVIQRADGYGYFFNRANSAKREPARPQARNAARSALCLPGMNAEVSRAI